MRRKTFSGKIDVHSHFLPAGYAEEFIRAGIVNPDGQPGFPEWSPELALEAYDELGIDTGILSISSPGIHHGDDFAARRLARRVNDAGAGVVSRYPGRFGLFASLPLPDVDGALRELTYALDELKADGIELKTNTLGVYLGDPRLDPVFDELNRRQAIVFIHPTSPAFCSHCGLSHPRSVLEFPFDTTRAITNLIYSGTLQRCPDITIIIPHAGGALPMLAGRIAGYAANAKIGGDTPVDVMGALGRIYYDTANAGLDSTLASTLQLVDPSHLLFGSDWPWMPTKGVAATIAGIDHAGLLSDRLREGVYRKNALTLFPRLGGL